MPEVHLSPLISGEEIKSELRNRKKKDIYKTISGSSKQLIAEKVKLEEAEGWRVFRRNMKSTRMAKEKPADEQLEDEVWAILAQMDFKEMSKGRHESTRVYRRLRILRGLEHEQSEALFPGGQGTSRTAAV